MSVFCTSSQRNKEFYRSGYVFIQLYVNVPPELYTCKEFYNKQKGLRPYSLKKHTEYFAGKIAYLNN
ncbi:hypothetical protein T4A_8374 [Trichinella pseudospiralis]|uniref:Uncharacterized protein n=1 Tax=Trichinella pseudospiralis TaxID=6337 RepID=A0A0V1F1J5_TRIPS|nr:hypothetical protein T4A_8374 [Trichinella pseudospiralis]